MNMKKTIQALSKMSEDSQDSFTTTHENKSRQFKSSLSDYCMDEDELSMSKIAGSSSKSVYSGAGIKLDAFDCFHKVLNKCVCDFIFSIADAALILKSLTPDIIKKILPLTIRPAAASNKKPADVARNKQDIQSEYGEEALDYEISEINREQKEREKDNNMKIAALMTKRPDAPRPPDMHDSTTRLSSPGSNSCSPVSAAVQALISISAPLTDNTMSQPITSHTKLNHVDDVSDICEVMEGEAFDDGMVFRPLSKPCSTKEFTENVVAPIPKPVISTGSCKDSRSNDFCKETVAAVVSSVSSVISRDEMSETINSKRDDFSFSNAPTTSVIISSTLSDHVSVSSQVYTLPDSVHSKLLSNTQSIESSFTSTTPSLDFSKHNESDTLSSTPSTTLLQDLAQCKLTLNPPQTTLAHNEPRQTTLAHGDPLMNTYDLLLNTPTMSVDLPCGLHSPFSQPLPASPMPSIMNVQLESTQVTTSIKDPLPTAPLINNNFPNTIVSQTGTQATVANQLSHTASMSSMLPSSLSTDSEATFMEQPDTFAADVITATVRIPNPLRTILPKPSAEHSSAGLSMVSVLSMTNAVSNSISQISPVIKIEDKKLMQYGNSIPPNQIFTKINPIVNTNTMTPTTLAVIPAPQQRQLFQNQMCYFSPQGMDSFIFPQSQAKEAFKNFFTFTNQNMAPQVIKTKTTNSKEVLVDQNEKVSANVTKPENRGGNLEVASALLSMASENESSDKQNSEETFQSIILESIKEERSNVQVSFTSNGTAKIKDVEINPQEHGIKKGNFTCGKCQHVFTSVLYLTRHIKRVCPDMSQRKWKCDRCSKAFRHPFGLQQHIYTHTGERPHKCKQCTKAFYSSNDLRRHVRTHSGERPYQCSVCEKSFSTTISLKTHQYIHTGEKPHKCPHCIKTFATSSKLSRHIVTHSDKRPYPCDQCAKTFNRSGDLRRHYNQQHGQAHALLECDHCNKMFATQKCLINHKNTHNRDLEAAVPPNNITENQDLLARTYDVARF